MKVLFLDIDGVLCTPKSFAWPVKPFDPNTQFYIRGREGWDRLDPECIERLNRMTSESGAVIVISSTWRLPCHTDEDFEVLIKYLHSEGVQAHIIDKTPTHQTFSRIRGKFGRGAEIKEWLETTGVDMGVDGFVIIDDNEDMGDVIDHLVLTSHKTGIVEKNIAAAVEILGRPMNRKKMIRARFRTVVFERDGNMCAMCDYVPDREGSLDAHHITDRNDMPNGGYVLQNGITLCADCHVEAEKFHSTGEIVTGFTPTDLYKVIGSSHEEAVKASERLNVQVK